MASLRVSLVGTNLSTLEKKSHCIFSFVYLSHMYSDITTLVRWASCTRVIWGAAASAPHASIRVAFRRMDNSLFPPRDKAARRLWDTMNKFKKGGGRKTGRELLLPARVESREMSDFAPFLRP